VRRLVWTELDADGRRTALARPAKREDADLQGRVTSIIGEVRARGWEGLCEIAFAIDGEEPH
jgi:histidinol dehydrogenase